MILEFVKAEEEGYVEQVITYSVAQFCMVGFHRCPELAEVETLRDNVTMRTRLHETKQDEGSLIHQVGLYIMFAGVIPVATEQMENSSKPVSPRLLSLIHI